MVILIDVSHDDEASKQYSNENHFKLTIAY